MSGNSNGSRDMPGTKDFSSDETEDNEGLEDNNSSACNTDKELEEVSQAENSRTDREEYIHSHKDLKSEIRFAKIKNNLLHRRLAEYYRKRKLSYALKPFEGTVESESKFEQMLLSYEELKEKSETEVAQIQFEVDEEEQHFVKQLEQAKEKFKVLQDLERSTGTGLITAKTGKPILDKAVSRLISLQSQKSDQLSALLLRYIRVRNAVAEFEIILRKLETVEPDLYVYQYEQLISDSHNYKNKIEERDDELRKNRIKITRHNEILAHIREKMCHTDELAESAECELGECEIEYTDSREYLAELKTKRDRLRWLLQEEKYKAGLLANKHLLRDFEDAKEKVVFLRKRKDILETQITDLTQQLRERRKIVNV